MNKSPYTEAQKRGFKFKRDEMISLYAELPRSKQEEFRLEHPTGATVETVDNLILKLKELKYG